MKEPIISISGIRGVFGESLTPENIIKYTTAFARYLKCKRIVIGRDGRLHGDIIEKIIESALLFNGCEVINLGIAPTPTIALAVETLKANGGIAITASHNTQQWNGMKFINSKGIFLDAEENKVFQSYFATSPSGRGGVRLASPLRGENRGGLVSWDKVKQIEYYPGFFDFHIMRVLDINSIDFKQVRKRKFKVVVDAVNSSGSVIVPKLLEKLGCKVIKIDCDGSGIFTRKPEPIPENLKQVCATVKKHKADIGIVVDPDADRLVIITEEGKPFGEENTITTVINHVLRNAPKPKRIAVVNLSTSRSVDDIVKMHGGKIYKSPVGEINVIKKMKAVKAIVGGEGSGGVIFPEVHYGRDSLVGIAVILSELAELNLKVSKYKKQLPEYHIRKSKISLGSGIDTDKIFNKLKKEFKNFPQNNEDGLRIDFEDSWVNFRKSNTEPIVRVIAEAKSGKEAEALIKNMMSEIG